MNKNIKRVFLFTTLLVLFVAIAGVSAADTSNDTVLQSEDVSSVATGTTDNELQQVSKDTTVKTAPETNVDYYVSDETGSDENDGSSETPFKTIQTAIDKTDSENVYNIYIAEGTYKGAGNTNLTVPGDNYINIIGAGINKTVIDGEADYDVQTSGFYWGSTDAWFSFVNGTGNWAMNITNGTGLITIQNFTVQHAWCNGTRGGSAIGLYPEATIDNWGTLKANNIYFYQNYAGVGAGFRNNPSGVIYVDNCTFDSQTKSVSTGNFGSALYNNGTAYVNNSYIYNNYARWGSVTNDKTLYIYNTKFESNKGYDGSSTYKNGEGIYVNTGSADYFAPYESQGLVTVVDNCTFINNTQSDINLGKANITVTNCVFNESTGIFIASGTNPQTVVQTYANNTFINMQPSTLSTSMTSTTKPTYAIRSSGTYNITIENNTIDVPVSAYAYAIYATSNTVIRNNTMNNYITLAGQNDTVEGNIINTTAANTVSLTNNAKNASITNNTLYSASADGDLSIKNILNDTTVENNLPVVYSFVVTNDNYTTYFDENGVMLNDVVTNGSQLIFSGEITNKDFVFDNAKVAVVGDNATLINSTITTQNNSKVSISNIIINNTKNDKGYIVLLNSSANTLSNITIEADVTTPVQVIKIEEDNNIVTATLINVTAPAADIQYNADWSIGTVPTSGIFIRSSDNFINNTTMYLSALTAAEGSYYPSVDGIDIQSKSTSEVVSNNELKNTKINVTGGLYVYGLNVARADATTTSLTYFNVTSTNCAYGVQIGDSSNSSIAGYVTAIADSQADGAYITAMSTGTTTNTNFSKLYIQHMEAPNVYGIELDGADTVYIGNATFKELNGEVVTVISAKPDWMQNNPKNINVNALTITSNAQNDSSVLMTFTNSDNVTVINSKMTSAAGNGIVLDNTTNAAVENNYIVAGGILGGNDAVTSTLDATIENNTPMIGLLTDDTYANYFDENGILVADLNILTLGGDLHNKDLTFTQNKSLNLTNNGNYTIYNGTITISGDSSVYNSTTGTIVLRVTGINFNNTDKAVFKDEINGTIQRNVYFANSTIYATGDDVVVFDAFNNESYIYLDISDNNITAEGTNVVVTNYAGYNRGQPAYMDSNNIIVNATNEAIVLNGSQAALKFTYNNVTQTGDTAVTVNAQNSTLSYSNFVYNNIEGTANQIMAINQTKYDTSNSYIRYNNISFTSENPITAINITGSKTVRVEENTIIANSTNNGQPVVYIDATTSSKVTDNYILANDVSGNDAVSNLGTISDNIPVTTVLAMSEVSGIAGKTTTVTAIVTTSDEKSVDEGQVEFFDEEGNSLGTADVSEGMAAIDLTFEETGTYQINATYTPSGNASLGSENSTTVTIKSKLNSTITVEEFEATAGDTVNITATVTDENGDNISGGKVVFKVNGKTLKDENGKIIYANVVDGVAQIEYTIPDSWALKTVNVTAVYSGTSSYFSNRSEVTTVEIANKEATLTITPFEDSVAAGSTITLKAKVQLGSEAITTGKIIFKINGKTIKDSNGKIIYATVDENGEVSVDYDLGDLKARTYSVEAVYTSSTYGRLNATTNITLVKN